MAVLEDVLDAFRVRYRKDAQVQDARGSNSNIAWLVERTGFDGMDRSPFDNGLKGHDGSLDDRVQNEGGSENADYYCRDRFGKERVPAPRL